MDYHKKMIAVNELWAVGTYCDTQLQQGQLTDYEMCDSYPADCPHQCWTQVARKDVEMDERVYAPPVFYGMILH